MNAMRLRKPASLDSLEFGAAPERAPGPGEIKVRVRAASLNFRDLLVATGFFPVRDGLIPLSDGAGEVLETGEGVTGFVPGDTVISTFHPNWYDGEIARAELNNSPGGPEDGFACTVATRPVSHFTLAPRSLSHVEAATLPCAAVTAWRAIVTDGKTRPGDRVLVEGAGGVSLFALQFAKAAGALVVATHSSDDKARRLKELGADHLVSHREEKWSEAVLEWTGGVGVDRVVEVGGPHALPQSLAACATGAHVALVGAAGGFEIDTMPFAIVQAKRLRIQGVTVGSRRDQINMVRAIDAHGIRPVVDSTFGLDQLRDAYQHLQAGQHIGKICIEC